jgi:hypothetical protein
MLSGKNYSMTTLMVVIRYVIDQKFAHHVSDDELPRKNESIQK